VLAPPTFSAGPEQPIRLNMTNPRASGRTVRNRVETGVKLASGLGGFSVKGHTAENRVVNWQQSPAVKPKLRRKVPKAGLPYSKFMFAVIVFLRPERSRLRT
jgi:hypothetical protein